MAKIPNSSKFTVNVNYFQGGETVSLKLGIPNSFYQSQSLDFRSDPSQMTVLPAPTALSTNLPDLITAMEQDLNGVRWAVGSGGNIYRVNTSNVISNVAKMTENSSAGILYNQVSDQLYIPGQTKVSMYGQVTTGNTGQPAFRSDIFGKSASTAPGCVNLYNTSDGFFDGLARNNAAGFGVGVTNPNQVSSSTANSTYVPQTTLSEGNGNYCFFAPDIEPGYSIAVQVVSKGTGNWTLTLHDSLNTPLAAVTITNGNMVNGWNEFVFGKQVRALVNASQSGTSATYHFHLTSTVADGSVATVTANDLSSANFLWFAYRLVQTQNGWHPAALFTGTGKPLMCIGNGQYLSTYDFSNDSQPTNGQWQRHQLQFKHGFEVCGLSTNNQYLVVAVERRSSNSSRNFQDGALYFWSGANQAAPDFVIDIPMGAPYGLYTFNNVTYFTVAGSLFAWSGGQTVIKVRKLGYQNTDYLNASDNTIVNPNMFTSRYNLLMMGYPSTTTNTNVRYGVYGWGTVELTYPNSLGLSYVTSPGYLYNTGAISNYQIGMCQNFVDNMYTSWSYTKNGVTTYGLDLLSNSSGAAQTFSWTSLIFDGGARYKQKIANRLKVSFQALPAGCTITPFYILDRGSVVTAASSATAGATNALQEINLRYHEIQYGFTGTCPAGLLTPPVITGVTFETDPASDEIEVSADG